MIDGLYKAAAGLEAYAKNQEVIASNLANASTIGFKKGVVDFKTVLDGVNNAEKFEAGVSVDFTKGSLQHTGNSLDMAIEGKGFFTIETEQGLRFTRNGRFLLSAEGELITSGGGKLMGTGGPIVLSKRGSDIEIDADGNIKINNKAAGELMISSFEDLSKLIPTGNSLYMASEDAEQALDVNSKVRQGYLEKSNVNIVSEMVNMIENMRSHEASTKLIKVIGSAIEKLIRKQG